MPSVKSKTFLKQAKGKKSKSQLLEDADDYLAAATDIEDGVGKHRGGDPMKSLRFAHRALGLYSHGLAKYPKNFDLAYNKARLELELGTHPVLVKYLDVPLDDILQQALESHRYALRLDSENADLLFNMAQLLTAIAERIARNDAVSDAETVRYLEEALQYQSACLKIQTVALNESRQQIFDDDLDEEAEDGGARLGMTEPNSIRISPLEQAEPEEQWFSVLEPVTVETLIDTLLAQLSTLTTLCSVLNVSLSAHSEKLTDIVNPAQIEEHSIKILQDTLPDIIQSSITELKSRELEIELTRASFLVAFLELTFRSGSTSIHSYREKISSTFVSSVLTSDSSALIAQARALIAFNSAVLDLSLHNRTPTLSNEQSEQSIMCWNCLSEAQTLLAGAAKLVTGDGSVTATTHALRGDISLLLLGLSEAPFHHPQAIANQRQLLKNAEVFYRNAAKLFETSGNEWTHDQRVYQFRTAVVQVLQKKQVNASQDNPGIAGLRSVAWTPPTGSNTLWAQEQLGEMIDDDLIARDSFIAF